jgi:hypothetical protein
MIKKLLLLATLPLLMAAAAEPPPPQRELLGGSFVNRHPINLPLPDLKRMAKEQNTDTSHSAEDEANPYSRSTLRNVAAAPSYRTLGDAAKAGVDPLNFLQTMQAAAPTGESENPYEMYYWAAALAAFVLLAVGGFIYVSRTPNAPEA